MEVLTKEELLRQKKRILGMMREGKLFIHPTDTIYGIGCDATNSEAVSAVRKVKDRWHNPMSILAPSKEWIRENCVFTSSAEEWLEKLPGPYTLILKLKKENAVAEEVNLGSGTIGVRIPDHWFSEIVGELNIPIVTTSANIHGHEFMTSLEDLHSTIKGKMRFALYEGEKRGKPSRLVDLTGSDGKIIER